MAKKLTLSLRTPVTLLKELSFLFLGINQENPKPPNKKHSQNAFQGVGGKLPQATCHHKKAKSTQTQFCPCLAAQCLHIHIEIHMDKHIMLAVHAFWGI